MDTSSASTQDTHSQDWEINAIRFWIKITDSDTCRLSRGESIELRPINAFNYTHRAHGMCRLQTTGLPHFDFHSSPVSQRIIQVIACKVLGLACLRLAIDNGDGNMILVKTSAVCKCHTPKPYRYIVTWKKALDLQYWVHKSNGCKNLHVVQQYWTFLQLVSKCTFSNNNITGHYH